MGLFCTGFLWSDKNSVINNLDYKRKKRSQFHLPLKTFVKDRYRGGEMTEQNV